MLHLYRPAVRQEVYSLQASLRCGPWARHIYPSLVLVQHRKTRPYTTERLLMGRKESNEKPCRLVITCSWLSCELSFLVFLSLSHIVPRVRCGTLIVSIPDLCLPLYYCLTTWLLFMHALFYFLSRITWTNACIHMFLKNFWVAFALDKNGTFKSLYFI